MLPAIGVRTPDSGVGRSSAFIFYGIVEDQGPRKNVGKSQQSGFPTQQYLLSKRGKHHNEFERGVRMKFPFRTLCASAACLLMQGMCLCAVAATSSQDAGVANPQAGSASTATKAAQRPDVIQIPGPLRSFLRMAGISQEIAPDEVMPLLARNAFLYGYQTGRKTEYLVLADRYVHLARELQPLAGTDGKIHVSNCNDAEQLIRILGYQFEHGCNQQDASLVTADAERAFLTVDSGFPLTRLEESLQQGTPFVYAFPATTVPILFKEQDWVGLPPTNQRNGNSLLDLLLNNQNVDRLYSAMARIEPDTRQELYQSPGLRKLLPLAPAFDFYGSRICIRSGAVVVPGGAPAEKAWQELVGASPRNPGDFVVHLLTKGQGWLAAYFDALSRIDPEQQAHFVEADRLRRVYDAYRSTAPTIAAATGVFPRNTSLLLLLTRIEWDANGNPLVPGDAALWQEVMTRQDKIGHTKAGAGYTHGAPDPNRLLDALAAYSNVATDNGPTQIYLMLTAINSARSQKQLLPVGTERLLADRYVHLKEWYPIFVEFPELDDSSITHFLSTVDRVNGINNPALRSNALGALQAEIGIWEILARQRQISADAINASWQNTIQPFNDVGSNQLLFEAARKSLQSVVLAATGKSSLTQGELVDLLAGPVPTTPEGQRVHQELVRRMHSVLDDQRLVALDTLFGLYDGLGEMAHGSAIGDSLLTLAGQLREFELPRPIFTAGERETWSPMVYVSRHAELQVRTDLTKVIKGPSTPAQLEAARARLAPFLRDTLVGLNYAYYEPPGAQVLHSNPLFVRSHDFAASSIQGVDEVWGAPALVGIGATAGGGAYLIGSLADLPYVLALTEEDFLAPEKLQALIWRETVPQLLVNSVLPRWWGVSGDELHATGLYQRAGEELLTDSARNADLKNKVIGILGDRLSWVRLDDVEAGLKDPESTEDLVRRMPPSDLLYLTGAFREKYPGQVAGLGPANQELDALIRKDPSDTSPDRIGRDFGVPHPTLAESNSLAFLIGEPFPVSGGYTNRLFGESWESSNLYWARLADEKGYPPALLNVLIPELTGQMVSNISATSIDDWPALMRAMRETGEQFRQGKMKARTADLVAGDKNVLNGEDVAR
jgi:hypothetical protein